MHIHQKVNPYNTLKQEGILGTDINIFSITYITR